MYALQENNQITKKGVTVGDLKRLYPSTSFPKRFEEFDYTSYGVVEVKTTEPPSYDSDTQSIEEQEPAQVDGVWTQQWSVLELSDEQKQQIIDGKDVAIRNERNKRLADTDWVIIKAKETGTNISAAWKNYRQELRDITSQEGFPHEVVWPTKPV
jgi:hypothetical protein